MTEPYEPANSLVPIFQSTVVLPFRREIRFGDEVEVDSNRLGFEVPGPEGGQEVWSAMGVDTATRIGWLRMMPSRPTEMNRG